jgi:hypothetical protein
VALSFPRPAPASEIDQDRVGEAVRRVNARTSGTTTLRAHAEITRFFDGMKLLEPGLVQVQRWQPGSAAPDDGEQIAAYADLARKPKTLHGGARTRQPW